MIWLILLVLLMCAALVACVFEGAIRADPEPYDPRFADPPLDVQRAKNFTGEEAAPPQVAAQVPAVVAGSDLDRHRMSKAEARLRLRLMVDADDALRDLRELPHDLAPLYVVPEVER